MSTTTTPQTPPRLPRVAHTDSAEHVRLANHMAAGANAGYHAIPGELAAAIRRAVTLDAARAASQAEERRLAAVLATGRDDAIAAALELAAAGTDPGDLEAPLVAGAPALAALALRRELLEIAARKADAALGIVIGEEGPAIWAALGDALSETLAAAAPDAPAVLAGVDAWADPSAVHRAPAAVQAAYGRLDALAARHDHARAGAVLAWRVYGGSETPGDRERVRDFGTPVPAGEAASAAGDAARGSGGVVLRASESTGELVTVEYRPEGHPVQRLALAASADPVPAEAADGARTGAGRSR